MTDANFYQQLLNRCRTNFGAPPRQFSFWDYHTYLKTPTPPWCIGQEKLSLFFANQKRLLSEGDIVWGCLLQANNQMFQPGGTNCPGELVYCADPRLEIDVEVLDHLSTRIASLKGVTVNDAGLQYISTYLANERIRVFGLPVPATLGAPFPAAISTVLFNRKHLPQGYLRSGLFPLIVSRQEPRCAMVLPSRYWPEELKS